MAPWVDSKVIASSIAAISGKCQFPNSALRALSIYIPKQTDIRDKTFYEFIKVETS